MAGTTQTQRRPKQGEVRRITKKTQRPVFKGPGAEVTKAVKA